MMRPFGSTSTFPPLRYLPHSHAESLITGGSLFRSLSGHYPHSVALASAQRWHTCHYGLVVYHERRLWRKYYCLGWKRRWSCTYLVWHRYVVGSHRPFTISPKLVATKLIVGANVALPIATMCICKHLELVSSNRQVRMDNKDRQRRIIFDGVMCFCLPLIFMALRMSFFCKRAWTYTSVDYVVQGHRYDIIEDFGCQPAIYVSVAALFLVYIPPLIFSLATLVYAGKCVVCFHASTT